MSFADLAGLQHARLRPPRCSVIAQLAPGSPERSKLLLADAVSDQRSAGALKLLDNLIEADPYEERYYVQAAEILVSSGNWRQALSMIERARRVLADMGVPSSASLGRLFQTIGSGEPDPHQRR